MRTNIQYSMFSWSSEKKPTDSAFDVLFLRPEQDLFDRVVRRRLPLLMGAWILRKALRNDRVSADKSPSLRTHARSLHIWRWITAEMKPGRPSQEKIGSVGPSQRVLIEPAFRSFSAVLAQAANWPGRRKECTGLEFRARTYRRGPRPLRSMAASTDQSRAREPPGDQCESAWEACHYFYAGRLGHRIR